MSPVPFPLQATSLLRPKAPRHLPPAPSRLPGAHRPRLFPLQVQSLRAQLEAWRLQGEAPQSAPRSQEDGHIPPGYISQVRRGGAQSCGGFGRVSGCRGFRKQLMFWERSGTRVSRLACVISFRVPSR